MGEFGCMVVQKWELLMSLYFKLVAWIVRLETRCYDMHATFYQSLVLPCHFYFWFCWCIFSFDSHYCYSDCDHDFLTCMRSKFIFVGLRERRVHHYSHCCQCIFFNGLFMSNLYVIVVVKVTSHTRFKHDHFLLCYQISHYLLAVVIAVLMASRSQ